MSGFINLLHNKQSASNIPTLEMRDWQNYRSGLLDWNFCDMKQGHIIRIKSWNFSPVQVFRMSNDFLESGEENNHEQVSKFNYRVKTIYIS